MSNWRRQIHFCISGGVGARVTGGEYYPDNPNGDNTKLNTIRGPSDTPREGDGGMHSLLYDKKGGARRAFWNLIFDSNHASEICYKKFCVCCVWRLAKSALKIDSRNQFESVFKQDKWEMRRFLDQII